MDLKQTPFLEIPVIQNDIRMFTDAEGVLHIKNVVPLDARPHRMTERLLHWSVQTPEQIFLAQRDKRRQWQTITYRETLDQVLRLSQFLLDQNLTTERPLAILSGNSVEHGLMALAALHIGLPYTALAPAYSLRSTDFAKLRHVLEKLTPGLLFVQNGATFQNALSIAASGTPVVAVDQPLEGHFHFQEILQTAITPKVEVAFEKIKPGTIAKILFTSGSTDLPKGVINTHGNITSNWQQITQTFPFMENGGLTLIDWLPWNHTFGGNHNFGLTLFNGGSLYIDDGNPTPDGLPRTIANLKAIAPTVYFNVPKGFEQLIPIFQEDESLRTHFFSRLKLFFYAGAGMPQTVWDDLEQLAFDATGKRLLIGTGLGMTEACPSAMFNTEFGSSTGNIGVPVPEMDIKLVPSEGKLEARLKGPNITPGYWRNPEATDKAFDEAGYYCTGDALKFVDPTDPSKGMVFDGRIAEDFKLDTGTWVNVGILRSKVLAAAAGLLQDVVLAGHDRSFVSAILFPDLNNCRRLTGNAFDGTLQSVIHHPELLNKLQQMLENLAAQSTGSSTFVKRAVLAGFQLSIDRGELTDKGSVNQRQVLANHSGLVSDLYLDDPPSSILII